MRSGSYLSRVGSTTNATLSNRPESRGSVLQEQQPVNTRNLQEPGKPVVPEGIDNASAKKKQKLQMLNARRSVLLVNDQPVAPPASVTLPPPPPPPRLTVVAPPPIFPSQQLPLGPGGLSAFLEDTPLTARPVLSNAAKSLFAAPPPAAAASNVSIRQSESHSTPSMTGEAVKPPPPSRRPSSSAEQKLAAVERVLHRKVLSLAYRSWSLVFRAARHRRLKLLRECYSEWCSHVHSVEAGMSTAMKRPRLVRPPGTIGSAKPRDMPATILFRDNNDDGADGGGDRVGLVLPAAIAGGSVGMSTPKEEEEGAISVPETATGSDRAGQPDAGSSVEGSAKPLPPPPPPRSSSRVDTDEHTALDFAVGDTVVSTRHGVRPFAAVVLGIDEAARECTVRYFEYTDAITLKMSEFRRAPAASVSRSQVHVGMACRALFAPDQSWYDAVVEEVTSYGYIVKFTGYGNSDEVPLEYIRSAAPSRPTPPPPPPKARTVVAAAASEAPTGGAPPVRGPPIDSAGLESPARGLSSDDHLGSPPPPAVVGGGGGHAAAPEPKEAQRPDGLQYGSSGYYCAQRLFARWRRRGMRRASLLELADDHSSR
jgi:hypothetical protein